MCVGYGRFGGLAVAAAALLALSACDRGPASIPARDHAAAGGAQPATAAAGPLGETRADLDPGAGGARQDPRSAPTPMVDGKPMWAANRRHTAQENARYQFARDGADFGARDVDDFVAKAHAFVDKPPAGVLTLTRGNGDRLMYDPKANVFAVVTREGAPRTMFKPRDGRAYWEEQKQRLAEQASGSGDDGQAYGQGGRRYRDRRAGGEDDQG